MNNYQAIEPAAKVMAATAMSQTLSFCMERKYLDAVGKDQQLFQLGLLPHSLENAATWIKVSQIGKPLEDSAESCFTAIQKILYSCFLPKEMQLLFMVVGDSIETKLYLGLRAYDKSTRGIVKNLNEFIEGIWPGLQTEVLSETDPELSELKKQLVVCKV